MPKNTQVEFDAFDRNYRETVNQALAFSGMNVDFFTRVKAEYFVDLIKSLRLPAAHAEVIDIGCGVADSHPLFAGRVGKLVGVDVSPACIARAAEHNPQNTYRVYDGINLPYSDASFDVASAVCVFHHVPIAARIALAKEVRRVLRRGGLFAIFEHNPLNPLTRYVVNHCEFDRNAILLRAGSAKRLLEDAGFHDVATRFILTMPIGGGLLRAVDRLFARLPLGAQYLTAGRA